MSGACKKDRASATDFFFLSVYVPIMFLTDCQSLTVQSGAILCPQKHFSFTYMKKMSPSTFT